MMILALLLALSLATPVAAQTSRTYAQILFKNGGAHVERAPAGVLVTIGSTVDPRRALTWSPTPNQLLALSVLMLEPLPQDTAALPIGRATWRCSARAPGCWVTFTTAGLGSYFRPVPNVLPEHMPRLRLALIAALQGADVPNVVVNLR